MGQCDLDSMKYHYEPCPPRGSMATFIWSLVHAQEISDQIGQACCMPSNDMKLNKYRSSNVQATPEERYRVQNPCIRELRKEHGFNIMEDRRNSVDPDLPPLDAPILALQYAIGRATGKWLKQEYYDIFYLDLTSLVRFGVVVRTQGRIEVDPRMLQFKEKWDRSFLAQRCRSQLLWHGGPYSTAALLSAIPSECEKEEARLLHLQPRLLAAEEAAARTGCHEGIGEFMHSYIWGSSRIYRLILMLIHMGELDAALAIVLLLHSNIRLSKGIEDIFAALRRLMKAHSANNILSLNKVYAAIRRAAVKTFPNVKQATVVPQDWEDPTFLTYKEVATI